MCGPMFGAAVLDMVPREESGEDNVRIQLQADIVLDLVMTALSLGSGTPSIYALQVSCAIQLLPRRRGAGTPSDNMCVPCETERDGGARPLALGAGEYLSICVMGPSTGGRGGGEQSIVPRCLLYLSADPGVRGGGGAFPSTECEDLQPPRPPFSS
jgi:hypothetical protein